MATPRLEINLGKISHNIKTLKELYGSKGINIIGVTKAVCGNSDMADAFVKNGISILADSRISNIRKMRTEGVKAQFLLLRTPLLSQTEDVVRYADISLNSEILVVKRLSKFAVEQNTNHKIILMLELGDLREGIMPSDLDGTIEQIIGLEGIEIVGLGTNLACIGGINPDEGKMNYLSSIANNVEKKFGLTLEFVSGGNSANYDWFMSTKNVGRINNLRIGESIFLGRETLHQNPIPGLFTDAFTLVAEIIESKTKPTISYGEVSQNSSGNIPVFKDNSQMKRAILGIGLQDVTISGLTPKLDIDIIGASNDHIIVDSKNIEYKVGTELGFELNYGALLSAMTSPYVIKKTSDYLNAQEYCESVETKYRKHLKLLQTIEIGENNSPLISLKDSGFNLIYEPSVQKNYQYLVREAVYEKIGRISKILDKQDKTLIIRSVWRSFEHQRLLWEEKVEFMQREYPKLEMEEIKENVSYFIAPPTKSLHSTGGAVDALIYDLKNDCVMDFGTNEGLNIDLNDKCYPYHPFISSHAKRNRELLINLFEKEDFVVDLKEYWHFDYGNAGWAIAKGENHAFYDIIEAKSSQSLL
jgi:predicted amino acid racemase/D-alanyl-D-alanine dipeptidase